MSKNLKLFLGISYIMILFAFLYFIFSYVELNRLDDFSYYKELQIKLEKSIGDNLLINIIIFFLFCLIWISLLGFGSPLLLISGIMFGKWLGTIVSVISITTGALALYIIANYFFKNFVRDILEKKFANYIDLFKKNEFFYFFVFRLSGGLGIPFGLQNILPVVFNIKRTNYFFASFLGFIPMFFIWNTIGAGLNEYIKLADNFSLLKLILNKEIYLPIVFFLFLMGISAFIKKKIFEKK
tara:strand:- start:190 stop:909 length:720 start_codon:yes stop_codon:yes gene_type:complete